MDIYAKGITFRAMKRFLQRVRYACQGWRWFFTHELHGQIQLAVGVVVTVAGLVLNISTTEWALVLLCIGAVLACEMINSTIEKLCNHLHPEQHKQIGLVKDMAAGAVLLMSVISVIVGLLIFVPYLGKWL
ncbi:MAG TPA: diacylglycerol kinase family protein [Phnomibacter sp.]|nr:diacylglycerol kinase family protein [Phnomibacter sp.]